jgi:hypothetical protein
MRRGAHVHTERPGWECLTSAMPGFGLLDVLLRKLGSTFISAAESGKLERQVLSFVKRAIRACCSLLVIWAVGRVEVVMR